MYLDLCQKSISPLLLQLFIVYIHNQNGLTFNHEGLVTFVWRIISQFLPFLCQFDTGLEKKTIFGVIRVLDESDLMSLET